MKKWIKRSAFWMLAVILGTAGVYPAMPAAASVPEKDFYYSIAAEEAVDPMGQMDASLVVVPWVMFSVESEKDSGSILTLVMNDTDGNRVDLYVRELNGLAVLCTSDFANPVSSVQMTFHTGTVYTAVAVRTGLYIGWSDGGVFLPYNGIFQSGEDLGCTYIDGAYVRLNCQRICGSRQDADGGTADSRPTVTLASPDTGDCLYADEKGFQNKKEESPAADKAHDTVEKKSRGWILFGVFAAAVILFSAVFFCENMRYFKRRIMKRRIIKRFQAQHRNQAKKKGKSIGTESAFGIPGCGEEQEKEDSDEAAFRAASGNAVGREAYPPGLEDAVFPEKKSEQRAKSDEKRDRAEPDQIQSNGEDAGHYFEMYTSRTVFWNFRKEMLGYNLDNDQIIEYMKSNHTEPWSVQLLEADIRRSCFVLAGGKYLWIHPIWMNCWNSEILYLNSLWFETNSIGYAFFVRKRGSGKTVLISALHHAVVSEAEPALAEKMGDRVVIKRKGVIYIR